MDFNQPWKGEKERERRKLKGNTEAELQRAIMESLILQVTAPLKKALADHKAEEPAVFIKAVKIARKLVTKLMDHPKEEKYRKIPTTKPALARAFFDHPTGVTLLRALGFQEDKKEECYRFGYDPEAKLPESGFLNAAMSVLRSIYIPSRVAPVEDPGSLTPKPSPKPRPKPKPKAKAKTPERQAAKPSPNPVTVFTRSEMKSEQENAVPTQPKPKKKKREFESCQLSIRFPDGKSVMKKYAASEKLKTVWDFVSPQVQYPYFELKPMGGAVTTLKEEDCIKSLAELDLCPATRVLVQTIGGQGQGRVDVRAVRRGFVDVNQLDYDQLLELEANQGKVKKTVIRADQIDKVGKLTKWNLSEKEEKEVEEDRRMCAICRSLFANGESVRTLEPCSHRYHQKCIDYWLTTCKKICPECTQRVGPASPEAAKGEDQDLMRAIAASVALQESEELT